MHIFILEMNIRRISLNAEAYKNRHNNELHKSQRHFDFTTDIEQTIAYRPYAKEAYLAGKKKAILWSRVNQSLSIINVSITTPI